MIERSVPMGFIAGWRGVLGLICPSVYGLGPQELSVYDVIPEGVGILVATLGINIANKDNLDEAITRADSAALQLVEGGAIGTSRPITSSFSAFSSTNVSIIALSCEAEAG